MQRIPYAENPYSSRCAPQASRANPPDITILVASAPAQSHDDGRTYAPSTTRPKQLSALTATDVRKEQIPGVVIFVARNGKVIPVGAIGVQDPKTSTPLQTNSILRIEHFLPREVQSNE